MCHHTGKERKGKREEKKEGGEREILN